MPDPLHVSRNVLGGLQIGEQDEILVDHLDHLAG
jgi:hypothetical protein